MPTKREREYYRMGFNDGIRYSAVSRRGEGMMQLELDPSSEYRRIDPQLDVIKATTKRRKLSAWQKYIKNKRNHIKFRDGKLNLKKMGVAFRRKQRR